MQQQEIIDMALRSAYRYLGRRPRAISEIRTYLKRKNPLYTTDIIDAVIERLVEYSYLDDAKFAKWYLGTRVLSEKKSQSLLIRELEHLGVKRSIIDEQLDYLQSPNDDIFFEPMMEDEEKAERAGRNAWQRSEGLPDIKRQHRIYTYLARRGYSPEIIKKTIAKYREIE